MTYYDHATAMAFKLGDWQQEPRVRNYELEALACEQRMAYEKKDINFLRFFVDIVRTTYAKVRWQVMIRNHMFVIAVQDLAAAAQYYESVLGFKILEVGDDGWRIFERDGCRIMAGHCPGSIQASELGDHSYFAYLTVDSADSYHEEVVRQGAEIIKPLQSESWGMREFGVRTNDGHRIMFGEDLDS